MQRRVTLKDIAQRAGVDPSAVSMALRNHPRISVKTREHIKQLAKEMGYRQDALLSALSRQRFAPGTQAAIAWIDNHDNRKELAHILYYHEVLAGTKRRAAEMGLVLEEFSLNSPGMTLARMHTILHTRQIRGIILAPQPRGRKSINMRWETFTTVMIGHSLQEPTFHSVAPNQYRQMLLMLESIRALGYRRIGLYVDTTFDIRCDNHWQAGFWIDYHALDPADQVPVLSYNGFEKRDPQQLQGWVERYRPEVIIIAGNTEKEFPIPGNAKIVYHTVFSCEPQRAGINENGDLVGATAVETLIGMLARNETGIPLHPQRILIEGFWQTGNLTAAGEG